jgi:hypothetical protein
MTADVVSKPAKASNKSRVAASHGRKPRGNRFRWAFRLPQPHACAWGYILSTLRGWNGCVSTRHPYRAPLQLLPLQ